MSPGRKALPLTAFSTAGIRTRRRSGHARCHQHVREAQNIGGPAHVLLHEPHRFARFQVEPAGVEADALADQRDVRAGFSPCHVDEPWRAVGGAPDGVDHREVPLQQRLAGDHLDPGAMLCCQIARGLFQIGRSHVGGRRVDQIAGEILALGQRQQACGVQTFGGHQSGAHRLGRFVAREAVAREQPAQHFDLGLIRWQTGGDGVAALGQFRRRRCQMEACAGPRLGGAEASQRHQRRAGLAGHQKRLSQRRGETRCTDPGRDGGWLVRGPGGQIILSDEMQRQGGVVGHGEGRGHRSGSFRLVGFPPA